MLRAIMEERSWEVVCPLTLRHHGNSDRLVDLVEYADRISYLYTDLSWGIPDTVVKEIGHVDYIFNIASMSGVEESIAEPTGFVRNNVELMLNLLELAKRVNPFMFLQMGTDEEYGPAAEGYAHVEWDTILPSNPYSASKAAQAALGTAWWRTYGLPVVLTRTMNLIGPTQSREKLVPTVIRGVLNGDIVPIYAEGDKPGSRHWIDVRDFADAWLFLAKHTMPNRWPTYPRPSMWHIVCKEMSNLDMAQLIASVVGKKLRYKLVGFHAPRPGHDMRYALDGTKLAKVGWEPARDIEETVTDTVEWYLNHREWL